LLLRYHLLTVGVNLPTSSDVLVWKRTLAQPARTATLKRQANRAGVKRTAVVGATAGLEKKSGWRLWRSARNSISYPRFFCDTVAPRAFM